MRVGLFDVSLDGGPIAERASPDAFRPGSIGAGSWGRFAVSLSADGRLFATSHSGPAETGNVVLGEWGKPATLRRLTRLNPEIEQVALGETEEISWRAPDGLQIFGLLIKPVGYQKGRRYPTVVEAHGGPRRSFWDTCHVTDSWAQMLATRGYLVLLPNPRGSEGLGPAFIRAGTDQGNADLPDVLAGVDHIVARGDADPARIGIGGWSYGGFLTAWAITQTTRFKAAVVGAGYVNQVSREGQVRGNWQAPVELYEHPETLLRSSPIMYVRQAKTPTLILHGVNDMTVPTIQSFELYTALRALHVPTEHVLYPGENHIFQETDHMIDLRRRVVEWFDRYLKPAAAGSSRTEGQ
jgi:dipeptidyl aminopeptidase/acylaminoacyl peptidase